MFYGTTNFLNSSNSSQGVVLLSDLILNSNLHFSPQLLVILQYTGWLVGLSEQKDYWQNIAPNWFFLTSKKK